MRRPSARVRAEDGYFAGLKGPEVRETKKALLLKLGLVEPAIPPRKLPRKRILRRVIRRCKGVSVPRIGYSHACKRKILITLSGGRPTVRCPECRVLKVYWQRFYRADPVPVILILQSLLRRGLIGRETYVRSPKSQVPNPNKEKE